MRACSLCAFTAVKSFSFSLSQENDNDLETGLDISLQLTQGQTVKHKVANVLWLPHSVVSGMVITLPLTLGIVNVY